MKKQVNIAIDAMGGVDSPKKIIEAIAISLKNNKENLTKWLANPAEIKPGTFMPNLELTEKEIEALIAYLGTLK